MEGRDVLACAMTGSGKTAAFVLPILHRLAGKPRAHDARARPHPDARAGRADRGAPRAPSPCTRRSPGRPSSAAWAWGRRSMPSASGVDVIVATPGRLLDHFRFPYAKLQGLEILVLDEADRMLDMGFLPDIRRILRHLPARRQTLFFSATMPAADRDPGPKRCCTTRPRSTWSATSAAGDRDHAGRLPGPLGAEDGAARGAGQAGRDPERDRLHAHQAPRQPRRRLPASSTASPRDASTATAARPSAPRPSRPSRPGKFPVLVATDIAARGIDVEALSHVINFDVPASPDDYVHRVGRTARAEQTGDAFLFVSPEEESEPAGHRARRRQAPAARRRCPTSTTRRGRRRSSRCRCSSGWRPRAPPAAPGRVGPKLTVEPPAAWPAASRMRSAVLPDAVPDPIDEGRERGRGRGPGAGRGRGRARPGR